jgi:hypothetical protein
MTQTATLTFDLTDPDARRAYHLAIKAEDMAKALSDFDYYLRNQSKHLGKNEQARVLTVRDMLRDIMSAHGINPTCQPDK